MHRRLVGLFGEATISLILKPVNGTTRKENYKVNSVFIINSRNLNKILTNPM
jgi:hypothetical protein